MPGDMLEINVILATAATQDGDLRFMFGNSLTLISHHLCPYVQRSIITLIEKSIDHQKIYIDLGNKPSWFLSVSPTGKVPMLFINENETLFESAVICEYLDEVTPGSLHPLDPLERARHRAWIEFGSQFLNDISRLYNVQTQQLFERLLDEMQAKVERLEKVVTGPYFAGESFSLVDAAYGPIFRYFDVLDDYLPRLIFGPYKRVSAWRQMLAAHSSVKQGVVGDYPERLRVFLRQRQSYLGMLVESNDMAAQKCTS